MDVNFGVEMSWGNDVLVRTILKHFIYFTFGLTARMDHTTVTAFIATLLFDSSMSALPIIVSQKSPSVGLFTH